MNKFPKISIITPSFNQAKFIRITIDSVLSQNYPNLEYIVMDGGSTDGTIEILKSYGKRITWYFQKDKGQSDALNRGFKMVTGEIIGFINSDDFLEENALIKISEYFNHHKDAFWLTGKCRVVDEKGEEVRRLITKYKNLFLKIFRSKKILLIVNYISQPSTFWRKEAFEKCGYFDVDLHYSMDYDFWLRMSRLYKLYYIDCYLACYRVHDSSKAVTSPEKQFRAEYDIVKRYSNNGLVRLIHKIHSATAVILYRLFFYKKFTMVSHV